MTESFTLENVYNKINYTNKKTKVICTMGPKCTDNETLVQMMESGMNIARLNFSHGDHGSHAETLEKVKAAAKQAMMPIAIMLDTKGPEIRTGLLEVLNINIRITRMCS